MAGVSLYDYQVEAVEKLQNGNILCGGVGSGKSRTALAYYYVKNGGILNTDEYYPMDDPPKDLYIITTARKRDTFEWEAELVWFALSPHKDESLYANKVVIDSWNNISKYTDVRDSFFIFDEQRVVGKGQWVKSFLKITKANEWILLSATPGDTWADYIPVFIANGFYKNRTEFINQHVVYKRFTKYPQIERYFDTGRLIRLRRRILVDMDFQRKTIAHHEDVYADYDKAMYKDISRRRWNPWKDEPLANASEYCNALLRVANSSEARQVALLEIWEKHPKSIIFYRFDYELEILKTIFEPLCDVAEWNGHKHQEIPESNKWVYLVQYTAGAEGWNCIKTDTIIFYSQTYSYKTLAQACGRIDRLNTPFIDLYYYHLKSRSSIDISISRALREKKTFNEGAFYYARTA